MGNGGENLWIKIYDGNGESVLFKYSGNNYMIIFDRW